MSRCKIYLLLISHFCLFLCFSSKTDFFFFIFFFRHLSSVAISQCMCWGCSGGSSDSSGGGGGSSRHWWEWDLNPGTWYLNWLWHFLLLLLIIFLLPPPHSVYHFVFIVNKAIFTVTNCYFSTKQHIFCLINQLSECFILFLVHEL